MAIMTRSHLPQLKTKLLCSFLTKTIEKLIRERFTNCVITIHIEPCHGNCSEMCMAAHLLSEEASSKIEKMWMPIFPDPK